MTFRELGESRDADPLWAVTVGDGAQSALLFGAPHPNEPIGSMTVDFLLHELATNDDLRASLDYEFVCVPVADPDGVRLNEGWFDGPFTLSNYAQNFYRPPPPEQVEATFPVDHEGYSFDDPTPATRALAGLIDDRRPEFVYGLHNAAFGGCYYYLSDPLEPLHATLQSLPEEYDVPLHHGEPERVGLEAYDDAVFPLRTFADQYEEAVETRKESDGADGNADEGTDGDASADEEEDGSTEPLLGGNAYDYASRHRDDVFALVVELPYFFDSRIRDRTELPATREARGASEANTSNRERETERGGTTREAVFREGARARRPLFRELRGVVRSVAPHLPDTPMACEATGGLVYFAEASEQKVEWAAAAPETDEPATVAQRLDELYLWEYHVLTYVGMLLRSIDRAAMSAGDEHRRLVDAKAALERVFHERVGRLYAHLDHRTIPIWKLVAIQARAGLVCLDYRQQRSG